MKRWVNVIGLSLLMVLFLAGCSKPQIEMDAARTAIDDAVTEGAAIYAKPELELLQADLTKAMDAVAAEDQKLFKSFGDAKVLLSAVTTKANELKATIPDRKEEARKAAAEAIEDATMALEEAKTLLAGAPKGKGTKADIAAMNADLEALEGMLAELQTKMGNEDYLGAQDDAGVIKEKASGVSEQVRLAMEKVRR